MKLYEKKQIDWENILFNNRTLFLLLLPIIIEQFLKLPYGNGRYDDGFDCWKCGNIGSVAGGLYK